MGVCQPPEILCGPAVILCGPFLLGCLGAPDRTRWACGFYPGFGLNKNNPDKRGTNLPAYPGHIRAGGGLGLRGDALRSRAPREWFRASSSLSYLFPLNTVMFNPLFYKPGYDDEQFGAC
jgi:hypothetical protein